MRKLIHNEIHVIHTYIHNIHTYLHTYTLNHKRKYVYNTHTYIHTYIHHIYVLEWGYSVISDTVMRISMLDPMKGMSMYGDLEILKVAIW